MLLYRSRNIHVYGFRQGPAAFSRRKRGSFPAHGLAVRVRDPRPTGRWRHWRLRVHLKGPTEDGRGLFHAEADSWVTVGGTGITRRIGGKSFVRIRAGLVGPRM